MTTTRIREIRICLDENCESAAVKLSSGESLNCDLSWTEHGWTPVPSQVESIASVTMHTAAEVEDRINAALQDL